MKEAGASKRGTSGVACGGGGGVEGGRGVSAGTGGVACGLGVGLGLSDDLVVGLNIVVGLGLAASPRLWALGRLEGTAKEQETQMTHEPKHNPTGIRRSTRLASGSAAALTANRRLGCTPAGLARQPPQIPGLPS